MRLSLGLSHWNPARGAFRKGSVPPEKTENLILLPG